jgi:hypothetical protein
LNLISEIQHEKQISMGKLKAGFEFIWTDVGQRHNRCASEALATNQVGEGASGELQHSNIIGEADKRLKISATASFTGQMLWQGCLTDHWMLCYLVLGGER